MAFKTNIENLIIYARTLKSAEGGISIADLRELIEDYKNQDKHILTNRDFGDICSLIFQKPCLQSTLSARSPSYLMNLARYADFVQIEAANVKLTAESDELNNIVKQLRTTNVAANIKVTEEVMTISQNVGNNIEHG